MLGDELIARERYRLTPDGDERAGAACAVCDRLLRELLRDLAAFSADSPCWPAIHALHDTEAWIGCGALRRGGWVIKVLAAGSVVLRRKLAAIRRELYCALGRREPALRRAVAEG